MTNSDTVSVIRTSNNTITDTVSVGPSPTGVAITPDGAYVYVVNRGKVTYSGGTANYSNSSVSVILVSNNTVLHNIPMGDGPSSIVITPNGDYAYVTVNPANLITVIGLPGYY